MEELSEIIELPLKNSGGRFWAAAMLFACVWGLKRAPYVGDWIKAKGPLATQGLVVFMAAAPAVALGLTTEAGARDLFVMAVTSVLAAGGIDAWLNPKKKV
jgi:hypothetical protein